MKIIRNINGKDEEIILTYEEEIQLRKLDRIRWLKDVLGSYDLSDPSIFDNYNMLSQIAYEIEKKIMDSSSSKRIIEDILGSYGITR